MRGKIILNSRYVKGTKWAISSVATCAAALSFMIVTNSSLADTNSNNSANGSNNVQTTQVQAADTATDTPTAATEDDTTLGETPEETGNAADDVVDSDGSELVVDPDEETDSDTNSNEDANSNDNSGVDDSTDANVETPEQPVATANSEVPSGGTVYDDYPDVSNNPLGVAAYFHIFANDATLNAHTNGNLAVQNLDGKVNFGTNVHEELVNQDISYIQNITNIANSSFVSAGPTRDNKVIFGENVDIDISNPNRVNVDGTDIDHLKAGETYQDKDGQVYIDFAKEFQNLRDKSTELANTPTSNPTITNSDFDDMNNRVIDVSDMVVNENGHIIINLDPEVLNSNTPITIKGVSSAEDGPTIIFNVDTAGNSDYNVNSPIKIQYDDGTDRDSKETEYFGDNHLLWNFTDSTASDKLNDGTINFNSVFQGSVLAPNSTANVNQNLDGNIIADKVNVNAETHRWDLQDTKEEEEEEESEFETPDISLPNVELPSTEEPEPENPGTEEPEPENPEPENPGTEEPEPENPNVENPDPENPDTEEPEPENPDVENPDTEEPDTETPDTEEPEPETPSVTDPDPDEEIDGENPGGPMIPAEPDVDSSEEDDVITTPSDNGNTEGTTNNSNNNQTDNGLVPNVPYEDNKQGKLPQTGSEHSIILTAVGLALAAGLAFVYRRRRD